MMEVKQNVFTRRRSQLRHHYHGSDDAGLPSSSDVRRHAKFVLCLFTVQHPPRPSRYLPPDSTKKGKEINEEKLLNAITQPLLLRRQRPRL